MKETIRKFDYGNPLTDTEVIKLYKFFSQLEKSLSDMGETFWLVRCAITKCGAN